MSERDWRGGAHPGGAKAQKEPLGLVTSNSLMCGGRRATETPRLKAES